MRRHLWWILGLALICGGLALGLWSHPGPVDFGWTGYEPLADDPDWSMRWSDLTSEAVIVSPWQLVGFAIAVLGLLVVTAGVGFRLGRRRGELRDQP